MGLYYVNAVLNGLKGRNEVGGQKLSSAEIALLVTIAHRQPNPASVHWDMDPICYGDVMTMTEYAHLSKSKFFTTRNSLIKSGLITYSPSEQRNDPTRIGGKRTFNNVYRINLKALRQFYPDIEEWKRAILRLNENDKLSNGVLRTLMAVHNMDSAVLNTDSGVLNTDSGVLNTDTNIHITKEKNRTNNTGLPCSDSVVDNYLDSVIFEMANSLEVSQEEIGRKKVWEAIAGKLPDSVYRIVRAPTDFILNADNKIGAMIHTLSQLPVKKQDSALLQMANPQEPVRTLKKTHEEIAKDLTMEARVLFYDVIKNTGYKAPQFLNEIATYLQELILNSDEKAKEEAVEICAYKVDKNNTKLDLALRIKKDLNAAYLKYHHANLTQ